MDRNAQQSLNMRNYRSVCGIPIDVECEAIVVYKLSVTESVTAGLVKLLIAQIITFRFSSAVYLATMSVTET
jgi:hypothetical protein